MSSFEKRNLINQDETDDEENNVKEQNKQNEEEFLINKNELQVASLTESLNNDCRIIKISRTLGGR